ncbi:hypothetical protein I4U23_016368 [Adineta vaga]|nr:hypothetical protein I4U23_016368 [Adineta vaga]
MDKNQHEKWTKEIQKVRYTTSDPTKLIYQLHQDIKNFSNRWPFEEKSFEKASIFSSQWYHLFLYVICNRSESITLSYYNMLQECRKYYENNSSMIAKIDRFAQQYKPSKAIQEYTRNSFVYRIVNHALRTQNMRLIRIFSPFIRDLHYEISKYQLKYYQNIKNEELIRSVYRGQYLSIEQLNHLRSVWKSNNPIVTLTTFGSTSLDPDVAINFASESDGLISCLFEIIISDNYNYMEHVFLRHEQVFANISSLSDMPEEREVLFSLVTHFHIISIEHQHNHLSNSWVLITLKLVVEEYIPSSFSAYDIIEELEKLKDVHIYHDILDMLEKTISDKTKFDNTNWKIWWNNLKDQWHQGLRDKTPLNGIFYGCFTNSISWSKEAIEMHKRLLHTIPAIQNNQSSFDDLYTFSNSEKAIPTRWIALFEEFLENICKPDTKKGLIIFKTAADMYSKIGDIDNALKCCRTVLNFDPNNREIQRKLKNFEKTQKPYQSGNNEHREISNNDCEEVSEVYKMQKVLESLYQIYKEKSNDISSIEPYIGQIVRLVKSMQKWYDATDCKIILHLQFEKDEDLSVNDYRFNFLSAVRRHISTITYDGSDNRLLSLYRYEKYMHEWILLGQLKYYLLPFHNKFTSMTTVFLPQINRLVKKLAVLISICTIYICIEPNSNEINVNNIRFIDMSKIQTKQYILSDDLRALSRNNFIPDETYYDIPNDEKFIARDLFDYFT